MSGNTLEQWLRADRSSKDRRQKAISILVQCAEQLDRAHATGEVHGALWPGEVLLTEASSDKVVAEVVKFSERRSLEEAVQSGGKPPAYAFFVSPEEVLGNPKTAATDQFAFAAMAYRVISGRDAFSGETLSALFYEICNSEPDLDGDVRREWRSAWHRALAKNPAERFPRCAEFLEAIGVAEMRKLPGIVAAKLPEAAPLATSATQDVPADIELPPPRRRVYGEKLDGVGKSDVEPGKDRRPAWQTFGLAALIVITLAGLGARLIGWRGKPSLPTQVLDTKTGPVTRAPITAPVAETKPDKAARVASPPAENSAAGRQQLEQRAPETPPLRTTEPTPSNLAVPSDRSALPGTPRPQASAAVESLTEPPGATVVFDGRPETTCTSPCTVTLAGGRHVLSASLPGYLSAQRIFHVPEETTMVIPLAANGGTLLVTSAPAGAVVMLDRKTMGHTPIALHPKPGRHQVDALLGPKAQQQTVTIQPDAIQGVSFSFR